MDHFWKHIQLRVLLTYVFLGMLLVAAIVFIGSEINHHLTAIEAWLRNIGPWSVVVFIVLFVVLTSLMVPSTPLSIIAGVLFGPLWGVITVVIGSFAASSGQYVLARYLFQDKIERWSKTKPTLTAILSAVKRKGLRLQVLVRLTPLSAAMASYVLGAARVRYSVFVIACLGLIPGLFFEVYFGHAGRHIAKMFDRATPGLQGHDVLILGGLVVGVVAIYAVSRMARKAVESAIAEEKQGSTQAQT